MQRSQEAANKAKSQLNTFPTRIRLVKFSVEYVLYVLFLLRTMPKKMSDTTPLKGLPSRPLNNAGFRNPRVSLPNRQIGKNKGGVKLLDITEQPMGYAAAKKRKRQQEMEEAKRVSEETAQPANVKTETTPTTTATPDYAANLSSNIAPTAVPPPAYAPPTPAAPAPAPAYAPAPPATAVTVPLPTQPLPQTQTITRLVQLPTHPLPASALSQTVTRPVLSQQTTLQPQQLVQLQQQAVQQQQVRQGQFTASQPPQILRQPSVQTIQTPVAPQQRRNLSLTKEQMLEAQEMFRTANKVTRPEKALILGFMAGSRYVEQNIKTRIVTVIFRDNPCPHLGNIVTIKLSENQENVPQTDNTYLTMIVETHFQVTQSVLQSHDLNFTFPDELQYRRVEEDKEVQKIRRCYPMS